MTRPGGGFAWLLGTVLGCAALAGWALGDGWFERIQDGRGRPADHRAFAEYLEGEAARPAAPVRWYLELAAYHHQMHGLKDVPVLPLGHYAPPDEGILAGVGDEDVRRALEDYRRLQAALPGDPLIARSAAVLESRLRRGIP